MSHQMTSTMAIVTRTPNAREATRRTVQGRSGRGVSSASRPASTAATSSRGSGAEVVSTAMAADLLTEPVRDLGRQARDVGRLDPPLTGDRDLPLLSDASGP